MEQNKIDYPGVLLITIFLALLSYAGFLSYKSIDWNVLKRLEEAPIVLPTPVPSGTPESSPSAIPTK